MDGNAPRKPVAKRGSAAGKRSGEVRDEKSQVSLAKLVQLAGTRPADAPASTALGFESATFRVVVRKAALNNAGGWTFVAEVPAGDADSFYPVRKAFEVELVATFHRKSQPKPA